MEKPIIQVKDLTYFYPGEDEPALDNVNLEINHGEFVLIIGASGCGKSTLSLCLNGIIPSVLGGRIKGRVHIDGEDTRESTVYELGTKIGVVFQDPDSQLCNLYVEEEVAFGPANLLMERDIILQRVERSLQDVGESKIRKKLIYSISGGQKQRVAIASILAMEPTILLFDEPTANLDPLGAVQIFNLMKTINREKGITVIVIEHNVDSVMCLANRLILMEKGSIRYSGHPREVMKEKGRFIMDTLGLRIPQVCELGLLMEDKGTPLSNFPLNIEESVEAIKSLNDNLKFLPGITTEKLKKEQEAVIQTKGISFYYPDGTYAVKDVSLNVNKGDVVALIGENGSGKTTLTSLFVGINKPSSGKGTVCGINLDKATIRELSSKVGYVFQYPEHQFVEDKVDKEIAFSLKAQKLAQEEVDGKVDEVLTRIGLEKMKEKHPFRLSMGQKRRLSVASMIILDTDILILDEPIRGQDRKNIETLMDILMQANRKGTTIIVVIHDMNLVAKYCNKVMVMDKGELVFSGSKRDFFNNMASIKSDTLVLPEIYELAQILREKGIYKVPEVYTIEDFISAAEVK